MKFTLFLTILATLIATVVAVADTNASRFARGMTPLAPVRRATGTDSASQHYPSGRPHGRPPPHHGHSSCRRGGSVKCCDSTSDSSDPFARRIAELAGLDLTGVRRVGLSCTPISIVGGTCDNEEVCCDDDNFNDLISANCNNAL